jgi:HPt (histidine-containing phosphotransfer) domain-containing protein
VEASGAHRPALDPDVLDELENLSGDSDLVNELGELFLADAEIRVTALDDALVRADGKSLSRAAHQLKGSAANVGAAELARLCSLLPAVGDPLDEYSIEPVLAAIRSELDRVRSAFGERASLQ